MHLKTSSSKWRPFCPGGDEWKKMHMKMQFNRSQPFWSGLKLVYHACNTQRNSCRLSVSDCYQYWPYAVYGRIFVNTNKTSGRTLKKNYVKMHGALITCPAKCRVKLSIHSQISTTPTLKFENGYIISSLLYNGCKYLPMLGFKLIHFSEWAPDGSTVLSEALAENRMYHQIVRMHYFCFKCSLHLEPWWGI